MRSYSDMGDSIVYSDDEGTHIVPKEMQFAAYRDWLAQQRLIASDSVVMRCYESDVPVPANWKTYRAALRAIITDPTSTETVPDAPPEPDYD